MTASLNCVVLATAVLFLILPESHSLQCGEQPRMNIIIARRSTSHFGTLYRFQTSLPHQRSVWELVTGHGANDISYFKAYQDPVEPEYEDLSLDDEVIGNQTTGNQTTGNLTTMAPTSPPQLRCGGFEMRVRVCRHSEGRSATSNPEVQYDSLTSDSPCPRRTLEQFSFYVAHGSREYEQTTQFRSELCERRLPGSRVRNIAYGTVTYGQQSLCGSTAKQFFDFHAVQGRKMCAVIEDVPASASICHEGKEEDIWQASLTFCCERGHVTSDNTTDQTVNCINGDWDKEPKACQKIHCGEPPSMENGNFTGDSDEYGSQMRLTCEEGHWSLPSSVQCQADGTWTQPSTTCQVKSCGPPSALWNGHISGDDYVFDSVISFSCDNGYYMDGVDSLSCQADGTWSGIPPTCIRKECRSLSPVINGLQDNWEFTSGATIRFDCHKGYDLTGERVLTCLEQDNQQLGEWDHAKPTCQKVRCPDPQRPTHGSVAGSDFSFRGIITYSCFAGFRRSGVVMARCGPHGQWDASTPTCSAVTCHDLTAPVNGQMEGDTFTYGSHVEFSCQEGYTIVGSSSLVCQQDGRWSDLVPRCQAVACPELPNIENGMRLGRASSDYGIEVQFACFPGYELVGERSTYCRSNRQWTNPVSSCRVCERNWYKEGANAELCQQCPGHSATLADASTSIDHCHCINGYTKMNDNSCRPIYCSPLAAPLNGSVDADCSTEFQGTCSFTCDPGFVLSSGITSVTCTVDGWSSAPPTCNACPRNTYKAAAGSLNCHPCPRNSHTLGLAGTSIDSCVCDRGYVRSANGNSCIDDDECSVDNGGCNHECINTVGGYLCQCNIAGYELLEDDRTCTALRTCTQLNPGMINGTLDCRYTEAENGYICFIRCNDGHFFVSGENNYVTCGPETNWQWSHRLVNASALVPACTEEFYVDLKVRLDYKYTMAANERNNAPTYEEQLRATTVPTAVETLNACAGRCWVSETLFNCTEMDDGTARLKVSIDLYLINPELDAVGPDCDSCRARNLRKMYQDMFGVITAIQNLVQTLDESLALDGDNAPVLLRGSVEYETPSVLCKRSGHVLTRRRLCVPCAPGTFLSDPSLEACEPCPVGTYQMEKAQTSCNPCYAGSTTVTVGSVLPTQCSQLVSIPGLDVHTLNNHVDHSVEDQIDEMFGLI